jgi:mRNA interferase YafQ
LDLLEKALQRLENDPHDPKLRTHPLSGDLARCWACAAGYDLRIVFEFKAHPNSHDREIHLLNVGTHDEVY